MGLYNRYIMFYPISLIYNRCPGDKLENAILYDVNSFEYLASMLVIFFASPYFLSVNVIK